MIKIVSDKGAIGASLKGDKMSVGFLYKFCASTRNKAMQKE